MLEYKIWDSATARTPASANVQGPQDHQKWLEQEFEKLSADGWELAASDGTLYIFKRPKVTEQPKRDVGSDVPIP